MVGDLMEASPSQKIGSTQLSLSSQVVAALRDMILDGSITPGSRLNEAEISERFGVSRGPVREAISVLEGQGLVTSVRGKGSVLRSLSDVELEEVYLIRIELEGLAAYEGAMRISDEGVRTMRELADALDRDEPDPTEWLRRNEDFHRVLYEASGRSRLIQMIEGMWVASGQYVLAHLAHEGNLRASSADHREIIHALEAKDSELCRSVTENHVRSALIEVQAAMSRSK